MSLAAIARKDLTSVRRSRALWAAVTLLTLGATLFTFSFEAWQAGPTETVQRLFQQLAMALAVLVPIVALVASYLAIAGERRSGGIKFLLGFPNTRRDVFLGKLGSRLALVGGGLAFAFVAVASAAAARHGALPLRTFLGLFVVTFAYAAVFIHIAVALSAAVASRSRAIAASVGSYFVLVILFVAPGMGPAGIVQWIHMTVLGLPANQDLYDAVTYLSPYTAFRKAANLAFPSEMERQLFYRDPETATELPAYLSDEFSLVIFAAWLVVPLVLGYLRFDRADLE